MGLLENNDPTYFTSTSIDSYDRHRYQIFFQNGQSKTFNFYDEVNKYWMDWTNKEQLSHVVVLDKTTKSKGGFA